CAEGSGGTHRRCGLAMRLRARTARLQWSPDYRAPAPAAPAFRDAHTHRHRDEARFRPLIDSRNDALSKYYDCGGPDLRGVGKISVQIAILVFHKHRRV